MAARKRQTDMVTIIYPTGCREITDDLGADELIRRLKTLAHTFQSLVQAEDENTYAEYTPLALHLADEHFLSNESRDVQLLVACCIADILRIFAPEAPYKDPAQIKTIFLFLIKQLGGLKDPKDPAFKRYFYLLENLAYVKSFNMCFDLEDCTEIFVSLFTLMFKIVNDEHSGKVKNFMLDVLCPLITEADIVANDLLDIILINIVDPYKTQRKNAYALAKDLIVKTKDTLEPYIQQFFNQVLILGKSDSKLAIARKVYDLIYELYHICSGILLSVLPQLEFKLKSTEESERMGSVSLLARMFSEKGSILATNHRQLWLAFLGRYNDISVAIRIKCVQYTMHFLVNHPELHNDMCETLKARQHDSEENVRYEVVMAIVSTAKKDFEIVSQSEDLLNFVKERTLDKKFKIRKEAMSGLALIYKKHLSDPMNVPDATKKAVKWIKDKILHGYYMPGIEDRLLVERLLNTCLVPFSLETEDRMKKLFLLFATIDDNASKAFIEVQKSQLQVRKGVAELIAMHRLAPSEKRDRDIHVRIHNCSKFLPEPVKAQEFIKKLSAHMIRDETMLQLMEKVVDPDISCKDCVDAVTRILKKLGSPIMTNLYYGTVKVILERVSSVMVDREAVKHLTAIVKDALTDGPILNELGLEREIAGERGLRLLFVLSFVFPSPFMYEDIIRDLLAFLPIDADNVGPLVLSILTFIGKHKPMEDSFPGLFGQLVPICKDFIRQGTAKQAKTAVKCIYMNSTDQQETVFSELLDIVKENLDPSKGEAYHTAIVALGHIAFHLPDKFPIQIKNLVSRKIVKELLMKDTMEAREESEEDWDDEENLPLETKCKMEGMKMMARWLIGLQNDTISAQKTFRMLNAVIFNKGDLHEEGKPNKAECAWLRLSAGCAMLKICEQKGVGDQYTVQQFYNLSRLVVDDCPQVRERFIIKLHKGLSRGIPHKCLPLDFMGLYVLAGLEPDKKLKQHAKHFMTMDINKRRDYIKTLMLTGGGATDQLPHIMPDYMLVFAIPILTHYQKFERYDDIPTLKNLQNALWFILEPLMFKNDTYSFGFYKALIEEMKNHRDILHPEDDTVNYKLWSLCDLAFGLIISRSTTYELKEFPAEPRIPPMYFRPPDDKNFVNALSYLPAELKPRVPKKSGIELNSLPSVAKIKTSRGKEGDTTTVFVTAETESGEQQTTTVEVASKGGRGKPKKQQIVIESIEEVDEGESSSRKRERNSESNGSEPEPAKKIKEEGDADAPPATRRRGRTAEEPMNEENGTDSQEDATTTGRPKRATRATTK